MCKFSGIERIQPKNTGITKEYGSIFSMALEECGPLETSDDELEVYDLRCMYVS